MGGPDSLEAVRPFLYQLFSDREIIRLGPAFLQRPIAWFIAKKRAPKSRECYKKIGGKSPLTPITLSQADGVRQRFENNLGVHVPCKVGMRYYHPRTPDVLAELRNQGIRKVLAVSLYPHYSRATSGSSINDFQVSAKRLGLETAVVESFPDHSGYVKSLAGTVLKGIELAGLDPETCHHSPDFALVYSAHSLPKKMIEEGDLYVRHLERTIEGLEAVTGVKGVLCFQSRSGPVEWLEPATDHLLMELARKGKKRIVVLPISFVSDHVETLYEIDMLYGEMMRNEGVQLFRAPALNDDPVFLDALYDLAASKLKEVRWLV